MLDKDRIRLMTKMSIYEKNYRDDFKIADYYRKDYASLKRWITLIWVTIGYAILFVSFCIYSSDSLSADNFKTIRSLDCSNCRLYSSFGYIWGLRK